MKIKLNKYIATGILLASASIPAHSAEWVSGTITRTISDGMNFGGCMIKLSSGGTDCPSNWVSLDCNGGYHGAGERNYSTALMAFSLNKSVSVQVDPAKKYASYCVATRIDVLQ